MSSFLVHKCVCHHIDFVDVKQYVQDNDIKSIVELQRDEICSTKCHMCEPYVELLLKTGEVEFEPGAYIGRKKSS